MKKLSHLLSTKIQPIISVSNISADSYPVERDGEDMADEDETCIIWKVWYKAAAVNRLKRGLSHTPPVSAGRRDLPLPQQ